MANTNLVVHLQGKDDLSKTIENVKKEIQDVGKTTTKLEDVRKKFDTITNSSAPLGKRIRDIKKEMEKLALSGEHTTDEGKKMWKELSEAAKQYDKTLQQIKQDTSNATSGGGFDVKNITSGIADKVGLGGVSKEIGAALTNPYVLAGTAIIGATKALYDYNVELDRSLQKTAQFTGLSGDELMSLRNGIKSVADTFSKDYDTVLSSVDGLMSQFGISGEEALQIIRDGFISGADDGGRMLEMISQYSGAFKDAGISASEMVAIISNTRSGIFSEEGMALMAKGATKIREFSDNLKSALEGVGINATEMYDKLQSGEITTVKALQSISAKLKELPPQSQEVGEVLKQVFGKQGSQAGMELVTALADVNTSLEDCKNQTGEWGQAMQQLQEADREFENALSSLFGIADGGFSTMTTKLKAQVYGAIAKCINGFIDWYNQSIVLRGAISNLALSFKNAWEIIKGILKLFMGSVQALGEMIEGVLTLDWNKVKSGWKNGMSNLLQTIATGFENIKENIENSVDQTLNGKINRIEVEADVEYSANNNKIGGGGKGTNGENKGSGNKSKKGSANSKVEKVKTQIEIDRENLDKVNKEIQSAISDFNKGLISKEQLEETAKSANEYFEQNNIKQKIDLEYSNENGFEKVKQKAVEKLLTPIEEAKKKYDDAVKALNSVNPFELKEEELIELKNNVVSTFNEYKKLQDLLSTEVKPSILAPNKELVKGSVEDKKQSLANSNAKAEEVRESFKLGLINADEAKQQLQQIRDELKAVFPELDIDLKFNDNGTITTATEDLETFKSKIDTVSGTVSSMGSVFSSLGGAIEGSGGKILNFAGQSISAIGQMLPQIMALITAKNAQAIAEGTASGAGLPFPANIAAIASIVATIAGIFASLPKFEKGGVVGGTSYTSDRVIARLNSGEGVLTRKGVNNLHSLYDNINGSMGGKVEFKIDGRVLKGVLSNVNSKLNRQS